MISLANSFDSYSQVLLNATEKFRKESVIYEIACAIFRLFAMACQYVVVRMSVTFSHSPLFPSALRSKNLLVSSRNIANLNVLIKTCLVTAWKPEPKTLYQDIGYAEGFRITHDLILHPAGGICLGKSMAFLSDYLSRDDPDPVESLIAAAHAVQGEKNETSVRLQALYDALLGIEGKVQPEEGDFFLQRKKNDSIHQAIIQAIASYVDMEVVKMRRIRGKVEAVRDELEELERGSYFIQFSHHTIVYVKSPDHFALFDPSEGLALFDDRDQQEGLSQLLDYYGDWGTISLSILQFQGKVI
jgi:hypothetical protein